MSVKYKASENCITIIDGYATPKKDMVRQLKAIHKNVPLHAATVFLRSYKSLKAEWIVHNFLYRLGIQRERTKDVDLDYPCDKPEWVYRVAAFFVQIFIK